jgi:hypothetical protein
MNGMKTKTIMIHSENERNEENTGALITFSAFGVEIKQTQIKLSNKEGKLVATIITAPNFQFEEIPAR